MKHLLVAGYSDITRRAMPALGSRFANLLAALESRRILPSRFGYISTSGVYGDCGGTLVDESRPLNPCSA